jgi:HEPN domain-containing protein
MTNEEKFDYWLDHAQYDLHTAESMFNTGRWFYVAFMSQQAIEKLVKGLYTLFVDDNVPRIHNIKTLFERFEEKISGTVPLEHYRLFETLSGYYISNRYPDFENKADTVVNKNTAEALLKKTKEVFAWLLTLKP